MPASLLPRHTALAQFRHTPAPVHPAPPHGYGGRSNKIFHSGDTHGTHKPSEEIQRERLERVANEISARSETVKDVPLDLFHPSEAALEKGDAFYYEMLRAIGPTKDAWRDYKKYIRRYETYLHDIRAFNGTIRNFISFSLSKLKHNSPEDYAAALYGFYNDERIAEKLIVNPIRNNGDCYTPHDVYELSYVPRPLPDGSVAICQEHVTDSLQALMKADYMLCLLYTSDAADE